MIYGLEGKDSGEITFKDEKITKVTPQEFIKKKILFLNNNRKQAGLLLNSATVDNMMMPKMDELSGLTIIIKTARSRIIRKNLSIFSPSLFRVFLKSRAISAAATNKN